MQKYIYPGVTKDNCSTEGYFHRVRDKNCFISAGWKCTAGANIATVIQMYSRSDDIFYYSADSTNVSSPFTYLFLPPSPGFSSLWESKIMIAPSAGTFTLQVFEIYSATQNRLL